MSNMSDVIICSKPKALYRIRVGLDLRRWRLRQHRGLKVHLAVLVYNMHTLRETGNQSRCNERHAAEDLRSACT